MTRTYKSVALAFAGALLFTSCASQANQKKVATTQSTWKVKSVQKGQASWYGIRCNGGTHTASGETLCNHAPTAAHKTLPMGTKVRVTNLNNGKSEIVKITDRGPYTKGRIIDVTEGVAKRIGFFGNGITKVKVEVVEKVAPTEDNKS
ncbi:septal ring lytic transglycosylase RlpA family protein [Haloferula chungangensis]|uniref:Probable endolytic peptidoglycan transglycosylase RlpA n=1 Tax=Haloferula chungangensis TaxID=1048331 RepID=A0ABW2LCL3_9BACT